MTGVWGWSGWVLIMLVPLTFWALVVAFLALVFGHGEAVEQPQAVEAERPAVERVREPAPGLSGLGWRPPVPSHH